jgi:Spy/CpxP family protein refolding chaperone
MTTKLIVLAAVLVSFVAGLMLGLESGRRGALRAGAIATSARHPATMPATRPSRMGFLTSLLNLTPEQQKQMQQIWDGTLRTGMRAHEEKRRDLRRERDEAIAALVRPEDKPRYDAVLQQYADGTAALEREMRSNFETAVEQTRQVLDPQQRQKYEKFLEQRQGSSSGGTWRSRHDRSSDRPDAATRPATQAATPEPRSHAANAASDDGAAGNDANAAPR